MIWNEFKKIWNIRILLLILVVGGIRFYFGPVGQMNLNYLPLWETVDVTVGAEIQRNYGNELDASEIDEIRGLLAGAESDLETKVAEQFPEMQRDYGFASYREFDEYYTGLNIEEFDIDSYREIETLYVDILDTFAWEIAVCDYYNSLVFAADNNAEAELQRYQDYRGELFGNMYVDRMGEILYSGIVTPLSATAVSNLGFVLQEYSSVIMMITLFLIFPYLAADNRSRIYPLIAASKEGRRIVRKQVIAVVCSVAVLMIVCDLLFFAVYRMRLPYQPFDHCRVLGLWFDMTFIQYFWAQVILINIGAVALAMIFFYISSHCRTLVGTVVSAIPCWLFGEFLSTCFYNKMFEMGFHDGRVISYILNNMKYMTFVWEGLLVAAGITLLVILGHRRKVQDIYA